jgi:low affinity Fe/Cu permease
VRKEFFRSAFSVVGPNESGRAPGSMRGQTQETRSLDCRSDSRMFSSNRIMSVTKNPSVFTRFAKWASRTVGRPAAFTIALAALALWAISGPVFGFSDTWQLIINTGTTIVTFLMVFLIQNTQNRDAEAMHVKLDELIRANKTAHNALLDLEDLEEEELDRIRADYERLAAQARGELKRRKPARAKRERPQKQPPES